LAEHKAEILAWPQLPIDPRDFEHLSTLSYALSCLQYISEIDIVFEELQEIHEDILGIYHFNLITEIEIGFDRSTMWLGAARSVSNAVIPSRTTRRCQFRAF